MIVFKNKTWTRIYNWLVVILALFNIWMVYANYVDNLHLFGNTYWNTVATISWIFFMFDYVLELKMTPLKRKFSVLTTFDLIALLPHHPVLVVFRIPRIIRIFRYFHVFGRIGISKKIRRKFYKILYQSGLIYLACLSLLILIAAALSYGYFEGHAFHNSFWWAINTVSGLGGFLPPKTIGGKIVAGFLMFGGVGFITLTTSVLTNIFTTTREDKAKQKYKKEIKDVQVSLANIKEQNQQINTKLNQILKWIKK